MSAQANPDTESNEKTCKDTASRALIGTTSIPVAAQSGAKNGEWPTYGGDLGNTRYSPLDQINADNFSKLQTRRRACTLDILQYQIIRPDIVDLADVGVVQCGDRTRFLLKSSGVLAFELLNRHKAVETCVAGFPHFSHASFSNE
jgi:hypothetical protein